MKSVSNPIALAALERALGAVRAGPVPRQKFDSRTADKFVIRGYESLWEELDGIGLHQGRSRNSESVAAILDALDGGVRSNAMLSVMIAHLGESVAEQILAEVPQFQLSRDTEPQKFVIRFPPKVRNVIKVGIASAASAPGPHHSSMNTWVLHALVRWVNVQRKHFALLTAIIAMNSVQIGHVKREGLELVS